jgi:hypothetical protein
MKLAESGPENILGMRWIPKSDMFEFQVKLNFPPKHRNIRTGKNIARNQIDCSVPHFPVVHTSEILGFLIQTVL